MAKLNEFGEVEMAIDPFAEISSELARALIDFVLLSDWEQATKRLDALQLFVSEFDDNEDEDSANEWIEQRRGKDFVVYPVEGGSANDYDYANAEPCNSYDLDGRSVFSKWKSRLKKYTSWKKCAKALKALKECVPQAMKEAEQYSSDFMEPGTTQPNPETVKLLARETVRKSQQFKDAWEVCPPALVNMITTRSLG